MKQLLCAMFLLAQAAPAQEATELYYVVCLRPDPARKPLAKEEGERIQAAHMANINSMAERGILVAAGPFGDTPTTISGIFVFRTGSLDEAKRIAAQDPTVLEHRNIVDVFAWRGPAGIGDEYGKLHKEHPETPVGMGIQPLCILLRGPAWDRSTQSQAAHAGYQGRLRKEGKLAAAGPVESRDDIAELVIFKRIEYEEAQRLMNADPALRSGALKPEWHHWWCAEHVLPW